MTEKPKLRRMGWIIPNNRAPEHRRIGQSACRGKAPSFCCFLEKSGLLRNLHEALQVGPLLRANTTDLHQGIEGETLIAGSEGLERPSGKNLGKLMQPRSNIAVMGDAIVPSDECFDVRPERPRDQRRAR